MYYILKADRNSSVYSNDTGSISNISNVPYTNIQYSTLNQPAKQWIYEYGYALAQEILGRNRQKYNDTFPSLVDTVGLNGTALIQAANEWKDKLIEQLRDTLEQTSRTAQLEKKATEGEMLRNTLGGVPLPFFIG